MDAPDPKAAADVPLSAPPTAAESDAMDAVRLEVRVEELERRLRARSIELETELKAKERLRERVRELTTRVDDLQETASALHREAASSTSLARELDETLKVAAEARVQLGAALEAERNRRLEAESDLAATSGSLTARASELEADLRRLTAERAALLSRADTAEEGAARTDIELSRAREESRALALKLEASTVESQRREEELAAARRNLSQLRQKNAGHEAHIESLRADLDTAAATREQAAAAAQASLEKANADARVLEDEGRRQRAELEDGARRRRELEDELKASRAEVAKATAAREEYLAATAEARATYEAMAARVDKTDSELLGARARVEELSRGLNAAQTALEQSRLLTRRSEDEARRLQTVIEGLQKTFDERQAAEQAKADKAVEAAEQIRREGVEAFEKAHEAEIRQDVERERVQKELAVGMSRLAAESEQLKAKAEKLKAELRARADREVAEMRHALDEERARLYADVEAEREARGKRATPPPVDDSTQRAREVGEARRREITQEVEGYLTPAPKTVPPAPEPVPAAPALIMPPRVEKLPPLFRWDEEMRLLLYVAIGVSLVAAIVAGIVLYQG